MQESLPDPRLRKALETVDQLKRQLQSERIKTGNLKAQLAKAQRAAAAKPVQTEQRAGC